MADAFRTFVGELFRQAQDVPLHLLLLFVAQGIVFFLALGYLIIYSFLHFFGPKPRAPLPSEQTYRTLLEDGTVTEPKTLPCWLDKTEARRTKAGSEQEAVRIETSIEPADIFMSVVVPAYNEEDRLVGMLEETVNYLEHEFGTIAEDVNKNVAGSLRHRANGRANGHADDNGANKSVVANVNRGWEILIVDDGSKDSTLETAFTFARTHQLPSRPRRLSGPWTHRADRAVNIPAGSIRVVSLVKNRGKGGAVTHGMRHARGQYVVFADADGASKFDDLGKLVIACQDVEDKGGRGVAVGSRAHLVGSEAVVKRSKLRNFLMHSFHLLLKWMTPPRTAAIRDTQCGFKLFSRPSLPYIIPYMHSEGWIFDVEMLMLAEFAGIPVAEVPVGWREVLGSKLNVIWDSLGMAYGLAVLRLCWGMGIYRHK